MDDEWVALHVFYASDANPIIVEAVRPLVGRLRADGLISGWFFIKYWKEGPHLRVRFKPASPAVRDVVTDRAVGAVQEFLERRPALYENDVDGLGDLYKRMYVAEYGEARWTEEYGEEGRMPFRPNNSVALLPYEPEYDRYGGEVGIQIAEWHFERSSDMVADLLATSNTHVRPVLLGLAAQLTLMAAYTFLGDDAAVQRFFRRYRSFWETSYQEPTAESQGSFDKSFELTRETFAARVTRIRALAAAEGAAASSQIERAWLDHCRELRDRVRTAAERGELVFPARDGGAAAPMPAGEDLATVLLSSYIHMTNNRLGAAILDEVYLSYLTERVLEPGEHLVRSA
ncbi:lantibiotic dehydratase C-terminal domain-containing protein [Actinomadura alba]|uniref:Lantibiotic biosynthesis protein n=1 Tax=Actinomadura alba TaxID=406431 RepID=A0ABR7LU11_9ACTN|nr:lantibiotic dehydratase C-terminal domain-containing protein [Actinomadura alba]MBC6467893.1 lantibiotic biosynthesis protein [Actinomadura alba]